jgi:hypothetical protein
MKGACSAGFASPADRSLDIQKGSRRLEVLRHLQKFETEKHTVGHPTRELPPRKTAAPHKRRSSPRVPYALPQACQIFLATPRFACCLALISTGLTAETHEQAKAFANRFLIGCSRTLDLSDLE